MAFSPALAHRQRTLAALAAGTAAAAASAGTIAPPMPETGPAASEYAQLLIALGDDRRRLQELQSVELKVKAKRGLIDRYRPWIEGALEAAVETGTAPQDEIVARVLTWAIDIADWPLALRLAAHVIGHGLAMPEGFKRQPAVVIAEEIAEAGLKNPPPGEAVGVDLSTLQQTADLTAGADMPDQVRAKLHKAIGLAFRAQADGFDPEAESAQAGGKYALLAAALDHLHRALQLDKASGVKKLIEKLARDLDKLAPPQGA